MYGIKPVTHYGLLREALSLKDFDNDWESNWQTKPKYVALVYARFPLILTRWCIALLWTLCWGSWRFVKWSIRDREFPYDAYHSWGRHYSPEPVICATCLWSGARRNCYHGYQDAGDGDCEPVDECPRCGCEI